MKTFKLSRTLGAILIALLVTAGPLFAQTSLTTTTLSTAVTDLNALTVVVASATGITAPGTGTNLVYLYVDQELMTVRTVSGTNIGVARGAGGTRAQLHAANSLIYVAPPQAITTVDLNGSCTAANQTYLPVINVRTYTFWNCASTAAPLTAAQGGTAVAAIGQWQGWSSAPTSERATRTAVSTQAYTILATDYIVALTTTSLGAGATAFRSFTLPSHVGLAGKILIIKDEAGALTSTTGIVLVGTIDGTNSSVATVIQLKTAWQSVGLYAGSGGWFTLWCSGGASGILSWGQSSGCR